MIPIRRIFEICIFVAGAFLVAMAFHAWLASHDDQLRLQSTLTAQKQLIGAVDARERDRAGALDKTLAQIQQSKRETLTPEEILREIQKYLPLPRPITMISPVAARGSHVESEPQKNGKGTGSSEIPEAEDAEAADTMQRSGTGLASAKSVEPSAANVNDSRNRRGSASDMQATPSLPKAANQAVRESSPSSSVVNATKSLDGGQAVDPSLRQPGAAGTASQTSPVGNTTAAPPLGPVDQSASAPSTSEPTPGSAEIPAADLKPLYDYIQDCRSCQAQLAAAKRDRADDVTKLQAIARERDAAIAAARGGSFWRRLRSNLKWFAVGAAAGAASAEAIHYGSRHT